MFITSHNFPQIPPFGGGGGRGLRGSQSRNMTTRGGSPEHPDNVWPRYRITPPFNTQQQQQDSRRNNNSEEVLLRNFTNKVFLNIKVRNNNYRYSPTIYIIYISPTMSILTSRLYLISFTNFNIFQPQHRVLLTYYPPGRSSRRSH